MSFILSPSGLATLGSPPTREGVFLRAGGSFVRARGFFPRSRVLRVRYLCEFAYKGRYRSHLPVPPRARVVVYIQSSRDYHLPPMRNETTVILAEMAARLNEEFGTEISELTPYDWWKRTKSETIQVPMPVPIRFVGRSPMFLWRDIKRWYSIYREEAVEA